MVVTDEQSCQTIANEIEAQVRSGEAPSWFQNQADWYRSGMIDCQTMINATGWMAQQGIVSEGGFQSAIHELLQNANLVSLGEASVDASDAINEQIRIREAQRVADLEAERVRNEMLADQLALIHANLTGLGEASEDASKAIEDVSRQSFFGDIFTGALGGGSIIILLVILFVIKGK